MPVILGGNTGIYLASLAPSVDPDAQAFITAASITNPTQQSAINQLVVDLKGYSIWTKFQALYPMVGGVSTAHSVNLKTPGTFNLTFNGGWTHSSTGAKPNGTNGYANTGYNVDTNATLNSHHISYYSRTNSNSAEIEIGCQNASTVYDFLEIRTSGITYYSLNAQANYDSITDANSQGFYLGNRTATLDQDLFKSGVKIKNGTANSSLKPSINLYIGAFNNNNSASNFSTKECAFSSIGSGLTDTEAANLYTAVQAFQTTLGRSIGTQTVSDADAQAFVTAASIQDQVEATAVNNLVIGLKADSLWTKMKAVYPFVGGSASSHKYNLVNPLDTDAAFRLVFSGGWTHSSTGATPNGTNAYADTKLIPNTSLSLNSTHISGYLRTNLNSDAPILSSENTSTYANGLYIWPKQVSFGYSVRINDDTSQSGGTNTDDIRGLHIATRTASNVKKYFLNTTSKFSVTTASVGLNTSSIYIAASRNNANYFNNQIAFSSIGDGLTDTDATNLNTRITTYQTALNRNV